MEVDMMVESRLLSFLWLQGELHYVGLFSD